jgi:hypothetical protein
MVFFLSTWVNKHWPWCVPWRQAPLCEPEHLRSKRVVPEVAVVSKEPVLWEVRETGVDDVRDVANRVAASVLGNANAIRNAARTAVATAVDLCAAAQVPC